MMANTTILVADNDAEYLDTICEVLEDAGYEVKFARDPDQARQMLDGGGVNLAILDMRLWNDADDKDLSGLDVARQSALSVPKLVLTRYPTFEAVREALGRQIVGLSPAVDFVAKQEGLEALLTGIRRGLAIGAQQQVIEDARVHAQEGDQDSLDILARRFFEAAHFHVEQLETNALKVWSSITLNWEQYGLILVKCFTENVLSPARLQIVQEDVRRSGLSEKLAFVVHGGQIEPGTGLEMWRMKQNGFVIVPLHTYVLNRALRASAPDACYFELRSARETWSRMDDPYESVDSFIDPQWLIGRDDLVNEIMRHITRGRKKPLLLHGMRRVGKTTILNQVELECREIGFPAVKQLNKLQPLEETLYAIVREFAHCLKSLYPQVGPITVGEWLDYRQRARTIFKADVLELWNVARRLGNPNVRLVLLLDELELGSFVPTEDSSEEDKRTYHDFGQVIKEILESSDGADTLALVGAAEYPWVNDLNRLPSGDLTNPFFHRFTIKEVSRLKRAACYAMVQTIGELAGLEYSSEGFDRIYSETRGHPYVTRWVGSCVLAVLGEQRSRRVSREIVDEALKYLLMDPDGETYRTYFQELFWEDSFSPDRCSDQRILLDLAIQGPCLRDALVARLVRQLGDAENEERVEKEGSAIKAAVNRLSKLGIIEESEIGGYCDISMPLLARWIRMWQGGISPEGRRVSHAC